MLRLSTFCMLLAIAVAQSGYEYNKPGKPFSPGTTPSRPGYAPTPSGGVSGANQENDYPATGPSSNLGYPGSSSYPTIQNQGAQGSSSQQPQAEYPSQISSGSSFPGQAPVDTPSSNFPGPTGSGFPSQVQNYPRQPGQTGPTSNYQGQGQNYPNQGQPGPGSTYSEQGQNYPGQTGQAGGVPRQPDSSSFGPAGPSSDDTGAYEGGDYSAIPGEPDKDYPILTEIPETSFRCDAQAYPGYYADVETRCQVFHVCANNRTFDFLCPNGTIFSQQVFVCVWWNQFDCNSAPSLYELNANLYDYSITGSKSQGELSDFSQGSHGTSSFPGSGSQGPSTGYTGSQGSQGPAAVYSGSQEPQVPSSSYPGSQGSQGSSAGYPGSQGNKGSSSFPGSQGSKSPSTSFPGSQGPQGPSAGYPGSQGPQGPTANYPGSQGSQRPSASYPASAGPQDTSSNYPGSTGSTLYSGSTGLQGQTSSYPGSSGQSPAGGYSSPAGLSQGTSSYPGSSQGYPSGKPSGPSFPTGNGRPQSDTSFPAQQPNREYLPPRN